MPGFNGSGTFIRTHNWVTDKTNLIVVTASRMDAEDDGIATGLSNTICRDGQTTTTARIPFAAGTSAMAGAITGASYAQTNDPNTGLYFPATDQWGLVAGGVATLTSTATTVTCPVDMSVTGGLTVTGTLTGALALTSLNIIGGTSETSIATDDTLPLYDLSNTANRRMLVSDFLKVTNVLSADATPDGAADYVMTYDASASAAKKVLLANIPAVLPRGYIDGLILSNGTDATNDINIAAGKCRDSTDAVDIIIATALGKQLDANWAAGGTTGSPAGGRNSAVGIANGTYHLWAARTAASSAGDVYMHTSADASTVLTALQAETGGASYAYLRHIGSIVRASNAILLFTQDGDEFTLTTPVRDVNNTADHTTASTETLGSIPTGIIVQAALTVGVNTNSAAGEGVYVSEVGQTNSAPPATSASTAPGMTLNNPFNNAVYVYGEIRRRTNTSAQVRIRASNANVDTALITRGWVHPRGKNG